MFLFSLLGENFKFVNRIWNSTNFQQTAHFNGPRTIVVDEGIPCLQLNCTIIQLKRH